MMLHAVLIATILYIISM